MSMAKIAGRKQHPDCSECPQTLPPAPLASLLPPRRPRVVLDSNIWVDLLVFQDSSMAPIRAALDAGTIAPVIRADCREELRRVLA